MSAIARRARAAAALLAASMTLVGSAMAQTPPPQRPAAASDLATAQEPGSELRVYLTTIGMGDAVWQRFGHNAIWIEDTRTGRAVAFNWGVFDFDEPNFLLRFLTGDNRYRLEGYDARAMVEHYANEEHRTVWRQELALAPMQRAELLEFIQWNAREENKFYRYDYYRDNCSTRVRDALDRVLGGQLKAALARVPTGTSYRWHTRRLSTGDLALYTGIELALGRPADKDISAWEESFLPVRLMEHARGVRVLGRDGVLRPLVVREDTLYTAPRGPEPARPPNTFPGFAVAGLALAALLAWLGGVAARAVRRRAASPATAGLAVVASAWALLSGFFGLALLLAGTVTRHVFMGRNLNLAAVNPLALVVLALLFAAFGPRRPETRARWAPRAAAAAGVLAALSVVGAVLMAIPATWQRSWDIYALALPTNVALWWAMSRLAAAGDGRSAAG